VPVPLPRAAIGAQPPGRDGAVVAQAAHFASSETAGRTLSLLLPLWRVGLAAGPPDSVWAGRRATQGGDRPAAGTVKMTDDHFAPHRVAAFATSGGGATVPEARKVAGIRPRSALAIEAWATRTEEQARRR